MKKKIFLMVLMVLALVLVLSACQKKEGSAVGDVIADGNINLDGTMPVIKDPSKFPKLKFLFVTNSIRIMPVSELAMSKKIKEITGVDIEWQEIPGEGSTEKINLMLASGSDLPDVFWNGINNIMIAQYMVEDIFRPTEDLIDKYMPRLKAILGKHPEYKAGATAPDGHQYGFPYIEEMKGLVLTPGPFMINTRWLEKVGKKMPATVDEFTDILKAFRDGGDINGNGKADEIPFSTDFMAKDGLGSYSTFYYFTGAFGQADSYCGGNYTADHMRIIDGKVVYTAMDQAFRETAKYFNMLKNERLIDMDSFSPSPSVGSALGGALFTNKLKGNDAVIGAFSMWTPTGDIPNNTIRDQYAALPRLTGPRGKTGFVMNFSEMQRTSEAAITTACKYPEVVAAMVDYCYEPEISITLNWGAEGIIYQKEADGRLHFRLDADGNIALISPYQSFDEMRSNSTLMGPLAVLNEYYDTLVDYTWDAVPIIEGQIINGKNEALKEYTPVPKMIMTNEETANISRIQPPIADIVTRYTIQWVLDGNIDATWNNYLNELQAAGVNDLLRIYQGAYDRYVQAMK
jgi:putative aldouronate transport system substrate-binding protein